MSILYNGAPTFLTIRLLEPMYPALLVPAGSGRPPVNTLGRFQQGIWVRGWLPWFRSFVWLVALVLVLVVCVPRAGGFICLSNYGPRLVLGLVVPRGVGFSLSRFGLVLVVCAVVSFYHTFVRRLVLVSQGEK